MILAEALREVLGGRTLELDRARRAMSALMEGAASPGQAGALIGALAMRGPTCDELVGFGQAVRERCVRVKVERSPLLDLCGSGAAGSFNISTAVAFIVSGAGVAVAKQVSHAVAGNGGSADTLAALGVRLDAGPQAAVRCLEETGTGFFLSSVFHPALQGMLPLRRELMVRTVFDLLEPLANPAGAASQLLGAYSAALVPMLVRALKALGSESAMAVCSRDGLGAFSTSAPAVVAQLRGGRIEEYEVDSAALGMAPCRRQDLAGSDAAGNAKSLIAILRGERGPLFHAALLNAAAALMVAGQASDLKEGIGLAVESVDSCRALEALESVRKLCPK